MSTETVHILDIRAGRPGNAIEAVLDTELTPLQVVQAELAWGPVREAAVDGLRQQGVAPQDLPQHRHWNWIRKAPQLAYLAFRCFGIECEGEMQGLMMVDTAGHTTRHPDDQGRALVHIEFLENAPWNLASLVPDPKFAGVGIRLLEAAVRFSLAEGFHGRIGLHSLPQAEGFYAKYCTDLGPDAAAYNLRYYEMTRQQAHLFLTRGRRP